MIATTSVNTSAGRYGKPPTGTGRSGYTPPIYGGNYNYSDKGQEESIIIHFIIFIYDFWLFFF